MVKTDRGTCSVCGHRVKTAKSRDGTLRCGLHYVYHGTEKKLCTGTRQPPKEATNA